MKKAWNKKYITELLKNFAIAEGYRLVEITKKFDSFAPTDLSQWMDKTDGHMGGWYHRIKHGHDPMANVSKVYHKFGAEGVAKYPGELFKDFCTPDGIPLPGSEWLVKGKIIGAKFGTQWCSLNITDVFTGGLAMYGTYKLYKKSKSGGLDGNDVIFATIGCIVKISAGVTTTNPILILSAGLDAAILIQNFEQFHSAKDNLGKILKADYFKAGVVGLASGVGTVFGTTALVGAFGTASTGTAIASLSGAAATNATLAYIGFGALATGGAGIIGGIVVLGAIGTGATLGVSYLAKKKVFFNSAQSC